MKYKKHKYGSNAIKEPHLKIVKTKIKEENMKKKR